MNIFILSLIISDSHLYVRRPVGLYHESFAYAPHFASAEYLDQTFVDMMWYKCFSVHVSLRLGFNTLFQVRFRDCITCHMTMSLNRIFVSFKRVCYGLVRMWIWYGSKIRFFDCMKSSPSRPA